MFLKFLLQSDNELLVREMQKKLGVTVFVSDIKRVENYPYFDKLAHVIHHGLKGFIFKNIKKIVGRKKRYSRKRAQNRYSSMKIMTRKTTTLRTLYVHVVLNGVICPQIVYDFVLYARHFLLIKFFPKCYFNKTCFELPQNVTCTDK